MRNALKHEDPMVRTHVLRILAEMDAPGEEYYQAVSAALSDYDPHVQRAAVETLARYGRLSTIQQLVDFRNKIPDYDSHLLYTTRSEGHTYELQLLMRLSYGVFCFKK